MSHDRHDSVLTYSQLAQKASFVVQSATVENNDTSSDTDSSSPSLSSKSSLQHDAVAELQLPSKCSRSLTQKHSEFDRIRNACPILRSTACNEAFCQAGRMIKTDEPRVGQDRSISDVQDEAIDFLRQLHRDGIIGTADQLTARRVNVLQELQESSRSIVTTGKLPKEVADGTRSTAHTQNMLVGGPWRQELVELEHGLRLAWQNSPKCIMRSESFSLQVCDLRHITTSREMGLALVEHMKRAYHNGTIAPTVCVFPPRSPGRRGPMVWNGQLLSFAGYKNDDDTVLGDPANVALTDAIMELGWQPPQLRTQWDLLPLVTMAEGEEPCITDVFEDDFPLVRINHPDYELAFEKLGLRWVPAPALSQLGFDIGGVQYTATPFIGWFMDAEIGVRNLADQFRYNVLPKLVVALGWAEDEDAFDQAPEHERLAKLSKAQAELTYAVFHSYREAGVMMSDSLTASSMYCNFDDEHLREKGYRLPANAYWLAPPQGSIVPIWHRGGAPNYQPKPMICRHVQDPIKAWRRETQQRNAQALDCDRRVHDGSCTRKDSAVHTPDDVSSSQDEPKSTVHIHYCTAANTARKLAGALHRQLSSYDGKLYRVQDAKTLNELKLSSVGQKDIVLIVASTTGHGEVPANGAKFVKGLQASSKDLEFGFMIFGNGSTLYHSTYNAAATEVHEALKEKGATPLSSGPFQGDTAATEPPWEHFEMWMAEVWRELGVASGTAGSAPSNETSPKPSSTFGVVSQYNAAKLMKCSGEKFSGILHVTIDVKEIHYDALSHITVILPNEEKDVKRALKALRLSGHELLSTGADMTTATFLRDFVDFEDPFTTLDWTDRLKLLSSRKRLFQSLSLRDALQAMPRILTSSVFLEDVFAAMPLKTPRTYSTACCQELLKTRGRGHQLELLVQSRHQGLVATFFKTASLGSPLRLRHHESQWSAVLQESSRPVICFATGSGLAPIRSLLQHRLHLIRQSYADSGEDEAPTPRPVTLILGFRPTDSNTISSAIDESIAAGVVDVCLLTPSNPSKLRAQDRIFEPSIREQIERKIRNEQASVIVCASSQAAEDFERNLNALIGCDVRAALEDRYVKEIFLTRGGKKDVEA
ncbi:hypothetical protein BST61_g10287 [Cercospora zeina]